MIRIIGLLVVVLASICCPLVANKVSDAEWPLFRGNPEQSGVADTKLPAKLEVLWKFQAEDAFEGGFGIGKGMVFAASMDEHVYALELSTGKLRWKQKVAPFKFSPVYRDSQVYVGDLDGYFHCFDAEKGDKKWSFETGSEVGGANFSGEIILVSSHDEHLYGLNKDGKMRWKFKTDGPIYGAPAVAEGKTFLVGCDSQMHVLDTQQGKELSSVDLGGQTGATAAVFGEGLYIGTMRNEVKAIDWKKSKEIWSFKPGRNAQEFSSSPAVQDKYVVIGSRDKRIYCLERKSGKQVWSYLTGNRVDSSPVIAGSKVVAGSLDNKLYILDLESGKEEQQLTLDGPIQASPAVVAGKVMVGTQKGTLYCLGEKR